MNGFLTSMTLFLLLTFVLNACAPSIATTSVPATNTPLSGFLIIIVYGIAPDHTQKMVACGSLGPPIVTSAGLVASATPERTSLDTGVVPTSSTDARLAFSASQNNNTDIYLLNVDAAIRGTGNVTMNRLTTDPATDFDPTWSPAGAHLAFRSQRDGNDEIYVMNADGTCQTNLTKNPVKVRT